MRNPSGDELAVDITGREDAPLVLLIHGFTGSKDSNFFPDLYDRLAKRFSVVKMDLSGHGSSGGRFEDMTIPKLLDDVRTVIDATASGRPVWIVGHSLGGLLAYLLAAERSDIAGLVLLAPGFGVTSRFLLDLAERAIRDGTAEMVDSRGKRLAVSGAFFESFPDDPLALTSRVRVPTLVLVGELDSTIDIELCRSIADALEHGSYDTVPDVGHVFANTDEALGPLTERFIADHISE